VVDCSFLGAFQSAFKSNDGARGLVANGEIPVNTGVEVSVGEEDTGSAAITIAGRFGGEELVTPVAVSWSSSMLIKSAKFSSGSVKDEVSAAAVDNGEAFANKDALDVADVAASLDGDMA
jgi:hypothetical protein